jgi:predicted enzyme related to lactoylglutathione lyase
MSELHGYQAGVPCWVDTLQPDPDSAVGFYAELFGWEVENRTASDSPGRYFVCMLRGRDVAGIAAVRGRASRLEYLRLG